MTFLQQVSKHYFLSGSIGNYSFIFPNRRALTFFKKHLGSLVAKSGTPIMTPEMFTMNDFFYKVSGERATDRVLLLTNLYDCYSELNPKAESLDEFIFWGDLILSDFNDVDKYLVNPQNLFKNISDYKKMQDDLEYLTDVQRDALKQFLSHFTDQKVYKDRFQMIWDILYPLYVSFGERLSDKGLSYEGMVYRKLADRLENSSVVDIMAPLFPNVSKYVFVGLNALNECEKKLLRKLKNAGMAEFCWDYKSGMISNPKNKSSFFLSGNIRDFPNAFETDPEGLPKTSFNLLSVPSAIGQAKQIPEILSRLGESSTPEDTAIVLPDEGLLLPVMNSIPSEIKDINVTMGYPISGSEIWSLMNDVAALQMHLRGRDGKWHFYHKQVNSVLSNSLVKSLVSDEGRDCIEGIIREKRYYVLSERFTGDELLEKIFVPVVKDPSSTAQIADLMSYQKNFLSCLGNRMKGNAQMTFELDFAREYYRTIERLEADIRDMLPTTYFRLLGQLIAGDSVPFKGEPLKGLQIMGPLETRALDFKNLIILSCNEGLFPRHSVASSFIPPELRKGFSLPTYEYQDAVWAYYFYRMIQRAENVWMVYDSRTEGVKGGETSRFVKQLQMHFEVPMNKWVAISECGASIEEPPIEKTPEIIAKLNERKLSASSIQDYLVCPAKFYYGKVENLKAEEDIKEALDSGQFGTVLHSVMQKIYTTDDGKVTEGNLRNFLKEGNVKLKAFVHDEILKTLQCFEIAGRNIIFEDIIVKYAAKILERDIELMKDRGTKFIRILGLEKEMTLDINGFKVIGYIDRLDSVNSSSIRIVDYKTGKVTDNDFIINSENAEDVISKLFGTDNSKRPKIALQLYIYDQMAKRLDEARGKAIINSIYQTTRLFVNKVEEVELNEKFCSLMNEKLLELTNEMRNPKVPFSRTEDTKTCQYCDFKQICGR